MCRPVSHFLCLCMLLYLIIIVICASRELCNPLVAALLSVAVVQAWPAERAGMHTT